MNPSGLGPTKLSLITGEEVNGIGCNSNFGPVFGGGNDLFISNNANTSSSSSRLGNTYQLPPGQQSTFFTGAQTSLLQITRCLDSSSDKTPAEKDLAVKIVKTQLVIDSKANSEFKRRH